MYIVFPLNDVVVYLNVGEDAKPEQQASAKRRKRSRWEPESSEHDVNVMPSYVQRGKLRS